MYEFTEALDILNDGGLEQLNSTPSPNRSKRETEEDLTNEERRVAGVSCAMWQDVFKFYSFNLLHYNNMLRTYQQQINFNIN